MMRSRLRFLPAAIGVASSLVVLTGCPKAPGRPPHQSVSKIWRQYKEMPEHRAMALAGDPDRRWVAGATGGHRTPSDAEQVAMEECRRKRVVRRVQEYCRLYASGDEVLWDERGRRSTSGER